MNEIATIEIYRDGHWQAAATIKPKNANDGHNGKCRLEYCADYAVAHIEAKLAQIAGISCRYPVNFDLMDSQSWPAFLLDILPNGAGRVHWLKRLDINDNHSADWPLLLHGAAFPPGNLRIREAVQSRILNTFAPIANGDVVPIGEHPGFEIQDILQRQEHFIEYAYQNGAQTGGASDVQGVAPKFLMVKDHHGRWHAEGVLDDEEIESHWLIKFPRGNTLADRQVLKNEAAYMTVARLLGLRVHSQLDWKKDTLLVPRFDRIVNNDQSVTRLGMESLCSLAGISKYGIEYGGSPSHNVLCDAISHYCSKPEVELLEYIQRDIVNIAMGNKDNHPRNTAVLKHEDGRIALTPLYDFAPMYLDPQAIARTCRWEGALEIGGEPDWEKIINTLPTKIPDDFFREALRTFSTKLVDLPKIMASAGVDDEIIEFRKRSIEVQAHKLSML